VSQFRAYAGSMTRERIKALGIGALALLVALLAAAFALGGSDIHHQALKRAPLVGGVPAKGAVPVPSSHLARSSASNYSAVTAPVPMVAPETQNSLPGSTGSAAGVATTGSGTVAQGVPDRSIQDASSATGVTATRIVKTGDLQLRVAKGAVQSTMSSLSRLATTQGGYVAESNTDANPTSPSGDITLRVPVAQFSDTVAKAEELGHVESLSTEAKDVTGKYVDLNARMHALQRARGTYLSILSRATTIGATLSVQQRIDDIQQQIDQLHGAIKLLGSQSSYSTLDVHVDQPNAIVLTKVHHKRHGLAKAWHTSIHRFSRGIDAIVAAVGPLLLAVLLIALAYVVIRLGTRGYRRHRSSGAAS